MYRFVSWKGDDLTVTFSFTAKDFKEANAKAADVWRTKVNVALRGKSDVRETVDGR